MSQGPPTSGGGVDPQQQHAVPAQPAVPAGWYPHPTAPGWEAYWDGAAWGPDTRPAQAAAPAAAAPVAQEPAVAEDPAIVAEDPAAQQPYEDPATAVQAQQPYDPQTAQYTQDPAVPSAGAAGAAAVPAAAATQGAAVPATAPAEAKRSDSSLPLILCLLGAIVAIVGCFLPMATADIDTLDIADNTLFAAGYGIAIIALAVLAAGVASYFYLKGRSTWIVILLGVVIVGIAAYVALAGLDNLDATVGALPQGLTPSGGGTPDQQAIDAAIQNSPAISGAIDGSASTGIFAAGVGGLLIVLGGIGISRQPK